MLNGRVDHGAYQPAALTVVGARPVERVLQDVEDKKIRKNRSFSDAGFLTFIVSNCSGRRVTEVHRLFDDLVTGVVTPFDCLGPEVQALSIASTAGATLDLGYTGTAA